MPCTATSTSRQNQAASISHPMAGICPSAPKEILLFHQTHTAPNLDSTAFSSYLLCSILNETAPAYPEQSHPSFCYLQSRDYDAKWLSCLFKICLDTSR